MDEASRQAAFSKPSVEPSAAVVGASRWWDGSAALPKLRTTPESTRFAAAGPQGGPRGVVRHRLLPVYCNCSRTGCGGQLANQDREIDGHPWVQPQKETTATGTLDGPQPSGRQVDAGGFSRGRLLRQACSADPYVPAKPLAA